MSPPRECSCLGGVSTTGAIPSGFAPGSEVKSSGERVLPYTPQPMPTPSSTDATNAAASKPNSVRFARDLSAGICAGALSTCRSATRRCRSPRVTALVAALTRSRCSSIESSPSRRASSRIRQASCRSLSLARVAVDTPRARGAPSHFATGTIVGVWLGI
ncbi:Uncharacterised protein [Mycobacterium tuberculosis]|nr:Uncharacterised protein [Mycobacterium tuberculosis]